MDKDILQIAKDLAIASMSKELFRFNNDESAAERAKIIAEYTMIIYKGLTESGIKA